jgi:hypothetical protein
MRIALAIPCCDDNATISDVVLAARGYFAPAEILVVDDGSSTPLTPGDVSGAVLLRHDRNAGLTRAVQTAARYALHHGFAGMIKVDADGQMDSAALPRFLSTLCAGTDVVLGTFDPARTPGPVMRDDWLFCRLFEVATGQRIPTLLADYRGYSRRALAVLLQENVPGWSMPLTLFALRRLTLNVEPNCIGFPTHRPFPIRGMLELRKQFVRYAWSQATLRARLTTPIVAGALYGHLLWNLSWHSKLVAFGSRAPEPA